MPQLRLGFRDENDSPPAPESSPSHVVPCSEHDIEQVTQALRPRILDYLRAAETRVGLRELRQVLGFPAACTDQNPLVNPVNRILKAMREAGEIACQEFERGEPVFFLEESSGPAALNAASSVSNDRDREAIADTGDQFPCEREKSLVANCYEFCLCENGFVSPPRKRESKRTG